MKKKPNAFKLFQLIGITKDFVLLNIDLNGYAKNHQNQMDYSKLSNRLSELIRLADNSKGLSPAQVHAISMEGSKLIEQLSADVLKEIFK